ncbi:hypothetical protein FAES_1128 [Fibrella aestuarina BUZ 2]|uniref:Uncharacterized protein n=2 Tax=Fibrella TaxID=861914 RepID=I0K4T5_9BACT|nr:hypothetical protein FAES_1128 [Fibrella aestuarina BUZ 2]
MGLALLPVLYYVVTVLTYAYDFPYMDDYPTVVDFLNRLPTATTVGQKVGLLMEQNNFHRLVLVKLIAWLDVLLTGSVDFRLLQYVGLALLLLTAGLLWQSMTTPNPLLAKEGTSATLPNEAPSLTRRGLGVVFLPALFLLFQFQGWNIAFWGIVAVSNVGAPALALLAFWLANRQQPVWAIGVGLVALFTNGNGILVLPLLIGGWAMQGRWRWVLATLAVTLPALWFYFQHYENPAGPSLGTLLRPEKLMHLLALDTAFLGALVYHPAVAWLPIALGSSTLLWMIYLLLIRYDRTNPTLFWLLVFLHLSGLMLAVNRIQNDTSIVFASRYRNITALHIAATYLTVVQVLAQRRVRWQTAFVGLAVLGTSGLWGVSNWTYHSKIVRFRELKQTDNLLWQRYGQIRACAPQYQPASRLSELAQQGSFRPEMPSLTALQSQPIALTPATTPGDSLQYAVDLKRVDSGFLVVSGWAKVAGRKANFNDTYVGVQTSGGWQYYTTLFHQRLDNDDSANDKDTGFTAIIPLTGKMDAASLPLAIFVKSGRFSAFKVLKVDKDK